MTFSISGTLKFINTCVYYKEKGSIYLLERGLLWIMKGRDTNFPIDEHTGHFLVSSNEMIAEWEPRFKVLKTYYIESEWSFENELLRLNVEGKDARPFLKDITHPLHILFKDAHSHHHGVMMYERL